MTCNVTYNLSMLMHGAELIVRGLGSKHVFNAR